MGWLQDQRSRLGAQRITLDLEQEYLLQRETSRLTSRLATSRDMGDGLIELLRCLRNDGQLDAELVGCTVAAGDAEREEVMCMARGGGGAAAGVDASQRKVAHLARVKGVKDRQQLLREVVGSKLAQTLEEMKTQEEEMMKEDVFVSEEAPVEEEQEEEEEGESEEGDESGEEEEGKGNEEWASRSPAAKAAARKRRRERRSAKALEARLNRAWTGRVAVLEGVTAKLKLSTTLPHQLRVSHWRALMRKQPWLLAQAQEELKLKAQREERLLELDEMRAVYAVGEAHVETARQEVAQLEQDMKEIDFRLHPPQPGSPMFAEYQRVYQARMEEEGEVDDTDRKRMMVDMGHKKAKKRDTEDDIKRRVKVQAKALLAIEAKEALLEAEARAEASRHRDQAQFMADFSLQESGGQAVQVDAERVLKQTKALSSKLDKLNALERQLDNTSQGGRLGAASTLGRLLPGAKGRREAEDRERNEALAADTSAQAMEAERIAKLAELRRQISDLKNAQKVLKKSPGSTEAHMFILQAEAADNVNGDDDEKDEEKKFKELQEKIRQGREQALRDKQRAAEEEQKLKEASDARKKEKEEQETLKDVGTQALDELGLAMPSIGANNSIGAKLAKLQQGPTFGGGFKSEAAAIENAVRNRQSATMGGAEGIAELHITMSNEEATEFASKQSKSKMSGVPFFEKLDKAIGTTTSVNLWCCKTLDNADILTSLTFTSADPRDPTFRTIKKGGKALLFTHKDMGVGGRSTAPNLAIWGYRDNTTPEGIRSIEIAFTAEEERKLTRAGFVKVPKGLKEFGLADVTMWLQKQARGADVLPPLKQLEHKYKDVKEMLHNTPDAPALVEKKKHLEAQLDLARKKEEKWARDRENPLKFAIETFALTSKDVDQFISFFAQIDTDKSGFMSLDELFNFLAWPRNRLNDHLFHFLDGLDADGNLDFGDFVRVICTFCLFGKKELLHFAFGAMDPGGKGTISQGELLQLLSMLHPRDAGDVRQMLRNMALPNPEAISLSDMKSLEMQYPKMFYPMSTIQRQMRIRFLGEEYWKRKMNKFRDMRDKLTADQSQMRRDAARAEARRRAYKKAKAHATLAAQRAGDALHERITHVNKKMHQSKYFNALLG